MILGLVAGCASAEGPAPRTPAAISSASAPVLLRGASAPPLRETPDAAFRATAPPFSPPAPFATPEPVVLHLSNGIRVLFLERHLPALLRVEIVVKAPPAPLGANGMAAATLWLGTSRSSSQELADRRDGELARSWTWAEWGAMGAGIAGLSTHAESMTALLAEVALDPKLGAAEVERALVNERHDRERADDVPQTVASRALARGLHGGGDPPEDDPASASGKDIAKLTRDDVVRAYEAAFEPSRATLVVVGDTTASSILPILERAFGTWKSRAKRPPVRNPPKALPPQTAQSTRRLVVVDRPHAPESYVLIGNSAPGFLSPDRAPTEIMSAILGGSTGRIARAIRSERPLARTSSCWLSFQPSSPTFRIASALPTLQTAEGIRDLDNQLRAMRETDVPAEELENARELLLRGAAWWLDSLVSETEWLNGRVIQDAPPGAQATYLARLRTVSVADLRRTAAKYLDPDRMTIVVVGDWATIRAQLLELDGGPIELRDASGSLVRVEPARSHP